MGKVHELKSWPCYFSRILEGSKTFELRLNDRNYCVGDTLILNEYKPDIQQYSGRKLTRIVTDIFRPVGDIIFMGLSSGWCIMSLSLPMSFAVPKDEIIANKKNVPACKNKSCAYYNKHYGDSNCKKLEDAIDSFRGIDCDTLISILKNMQVGCMDNASVEKSDKCITCRYCVPFGSENTNGECMYNPPVIKAETGLRGFRPFCMDIEKEYCSKHERRNK